MKAEQSTIADFRQTDILTAKLDTHDLVFSSIKRGFSGLEQQIPRNATGMTHSRLERTQELVGVLKMADGLKAEMSDVAKKLYSSDELSENLVKKAGEVKGRLKAFEKKLEQFTENTSKFVIRLRQWAHEGRQHGMRESDIQEISLNASKIGAGCKAAVENVAAISRNWERNVMSAQKVFQDKTDEINRSSGIDT